MIPSDGVSGCFFPAGPLSPAMPDLDPLAIENLLHEGALRRRNGRRLSRPGSSKADIARVSFATALQVIAVFEKMPPQA